MKNTSIQLIRNATLKINYAGKTLLIDPMFSSVNSFMSFVKPDENLNPTVDLPMPIEEITEGIDAIFLTHPHPDHFDPKAMEVLNKTLSFFTQPSDEKMVKDAGFKNVHEIDSVMDFDGITISRTNGVHGPEALLDKLGVVSGFVLQAKDEPTIYIIGDCLWDDVVEGTVEKFNPDIIVTNSGGAVFMGEYKILMDEEATVKVAKKAPNAKIITVHMESLDHCMTTRDMMRNKAKEENVEIIIPEDGEVINF
ncbi:MBL fold metallo-hydrolase [Aureivirga sp. CE67]|uniref:MBL fold metallo-hydrolase n=1 Tax=Aureivirga sp. CE67 TaxID=1788983 RepID=UPI0018C95E26|nr:MBL fold metallo-hydrolase [Aureivirga sp. CE67]